MKEAVEVGPSTLGNQVTKEGGPILTRILIFERPDLFNQCPEEVQKAISLYHQGVSLQSTTRHEEGRKLIQAAFEILKPK